MRVALGHIWQETNMLNLLATTRADFESLGVLRGEELLRRMADTNELGGMIQTLAAWPEPPALRGLAALPAWPSGLATAETYDWLAAETLSALEAARPVDAVLLALHGAMVAEGHDDVEGDLLDAVRARVGPKVPIVATLDLHTHLTERMVRAADALVFYHTMPHVDRFETGVRAANLLRRMLFEGARPVTAWQKIPAVVPAERSSTEAASGVAVDLKRRVQELERDPRVLTAGVNPVQPWLDLPGLGAAILVVTDGDERLATAECAALAEKFWQRRREYLPELTPLADAVRKAHELPDGLTVLSDGSDATTSGAPGDSVWFIEEMLRHRWPRPALAALVAPEVVAQAEAAGLGETIQTTLGGRRDTRFGKSLPFRGRVDRIFQGKFTLSGHIGRNFTIDIGRCATLTHEQGVSVVVTERTGPHFAPELFAAAGFDPFAAQLLVAKSPCGFRAAYESRARQIFHVATPGCAPPDFWNVPYTRITRPLWPWDEIADWRPAPQVIHAPTNRA